MQVLVSILAYNLLKRSCIFYLLLFLFPCILSAQNKLMLSGRITEEQFPLAYAHIYIEELHNGVYSDSSGFYVVALDKGTYHITYSYIGYKTIQKKVLIDADKRMDITLQPSTLHQPEIVINLDKEQEIFENTHSVNRLSQADLKKNPSLLGEPDPIKLLQHTAGVTNAGDGQGGLFVRGGDSDHTRILFNQATLYNPSHLLGVFSTFHPETVHKVSLYTGGASPLYSGLIGSYLDVRSSEKIPQRVRFDASLGILTSRIHLAAPISSKTALTLSARRSHITSIIKPLLNKIDSENELLSQSKYDFYDYNLSFLWQISDKDRISLHAYTGNDQADLPFQLYDVSFQMGWQNTVSALKWQHNFNDDLFMEQIFSGSYYQSHSKFSQANYLGKLNTRLYDLNYKGVVHYLLNNHRIEPGYEITFNHTISGNSRLTLDDTPLSQSSSLRFANTRLGLFINDEITCRQWVFNLGIRYTYYRNHPLIADDKPTSFHEWEPRLSMRYALHECHALKMSYTQHVQFTHLIPLSSSTGLPMDYWIPASQKIPPQHGWQWSGGYFYRSNSRYPISWSAEIYYKRLFDQLESKNNLISVFEHSQTMQLLERGKGEAYGLELQFKKEGRLWEIQAAYTLAKNMRLFTTMNQGDPFPACNDRRHDLSLLVNYTPNRKWQFSTAFVYASGKPVSVPSELIFIGGAAINNYQRYNSQRMPAYHRMDLSITRTFHHNEKFYSELNFSFYNLYWRKNTFILFFTSEDNQCVARQGSLFPVIPSLSWSIHF